jgi:gliding motility-associated-like protein
VNSFAQLIRFNITTVNVACQESKPGEARVQVTSGSGPYTYLWSNGQTTQQILSLPKGDYSITITDALGNDTTGNFSILVDECHMDAARVFTPNDDGIHDVWGISNAQYFDNALILVYNRLGQLVYEHKGKYTTDDQWDGKDKLGVPLPDATYYFVILEDKSEKSNVIKGDVSILR